MNKQELLDDLLGKTWCASFNGVPKLIETKADGSNWYIQNIKEVQSGSVAIYRYISFFVGDEGLETENAYYESAVPETTTQEVLVFTEKVGAYVLTQENTFLEKVDEDNKFGIIKKLVGDKNGISVHEERYLVKEVEVDGEMVISTKEIV